MAISDLPGLVSKIKKFRIPGGYPPGTPRGTLPDTPRAPQGTPRDPQGSPPQGSPGDPPGDTQRTPQGTPQAPA